MTLLVACSSDNTDIPEHKLTDKERYEFIAIDYNLQDKVEVRDEDRTKTYLYTNSSNKDRTEVYKPQAPDMYFSSGDLVVNHFFEESILVHLPEYINGTEVVLSEKTYPFSPKVTQLPYKSFTLTEFTVRANSKVRLTVEYSVERELIDFTLSYRDHQLKANKVAYGKLIKTKYSYFENAILSEEND